MIVRPPMPRLALAVAFVIGLSAPRPAQAPLTVRDLDGRASTPLAAAHGQTNLIVFLNAECPISARYAPEIDRITAEYGRKGVRTWLVYADPALSVPAARANLGDFHPHTTATVVIDAGFALTAAVDATVTPEAAVYTDSGRVYRGRIDDLYIAIGSAKRAPARHDLRVALDAVLAGRPVPAAETSPVGCFIERKNP
jgi:hypothetical protein